MVMPVLRIMASTDTDQMVRSISVWMESIAPSKLEPSSSSSSSDTGAGTCRGPDNVIRAGHRRPCQAEWRHTAATSRVDICRMKPWILPTRYP